MPASAQTCSTVTPSNPCRSNALSAIFSTRRRACSRFSARASTYRGTCGVRAAAGAGRSRDSEPLAVTGMHLAPCGASGRPPPRGSESAHHGSFLPDTVPVGRGRGRSRCLALGPAAVLVVSGGLLSERERVRLDTGFAEGDLQCALADRVVLANQLVHAATVQHAGPVCVEVDTVGGAGRFPIEEDLERDRVTGPRGQHRVRHGRGTGRRSPRWPGRGRRVRCRPSRHRPGPSGSAAGRRAASRSCPGRAHR